LAKVAPVPGWLTLLCYGACALATAACSLAGDPDYRVIDAGEPDLGEAAPGEPASGEPAPGESDPGMTVTVSCAADTPCTVNKDCCGYFEGQSLCVLEAAGNGAESICLQLCDTRPCPEDHACAPLNVGSSVCVPR
jgi:hypothetical protein